MNEAIASYRLLVWCVRLTDLIAMVGVFVLAAALTSPELQFIGLREFLALQIQASNVLVFGCFLVLWAFLLHAHQVYTELGFSSLIRNGLALIRAISIGTLVLLVIAAVFDIAVVDLKFLVILWSGSLALGVFTRVLAGAFLMYRNLQSKNLVNFIVIGKNPRAQRFVRAIDNDTKGPPHRFLGFVDVDFRRYAVQTDESAEKILTNLANLQAFLRETPVDEVVICLPLKSYYDETSRVVSFCEEQGITVRILADLFHTRMTHSRVGSLGGHSLITVASHEMRGVPAMIKRGIDVALSLALLLTLSPFMLVAGVLVLTTSPGPVLFSQERVGLNRETFRMHKFRTMVADAEVRQAALESVNEAEGPVFKIHNDPRVTLVGRVLRKASIDELPQLLNVLKGEMSLVGPRPLPLRDYKGFKEDWHRRRLSVKPGITGLWQVKDRDHDSFERWMKLDMQYIDQWSLGLDLNIILQTIPAVLRGSGE